MTRRTRTSVLAEPPETPVTQTPIVRSHNTPKRMEQIAEHLEGEASAWAEKAEQIYAEVAQHEQTFASKKAEAERILAEAQDERDNADRKRKEADKYKAGAEDNRNSAADFREMAAKQQAHLQIAAMGKEPDLAALARFNEAHDEHAAEVAS